MFAMLCCSAELLGGLVSIPQEQILHVLSELLVTNNKSVEIHTIRKATSQVVNGILYNIDIECNIGNISAEIWKQATQTHITYCYLNNAQC